MRGIKSRKKRLLKKYFWKLNPYEYTMINPMHVENTKDVIRHISSSHFLRMTYDKSKFEEGDK